MGTDVQIAVHPRACHAESMVEQILDKVVRMVHEMEQRMSRFHPTSDICQINQGAGRWVEIHPATFEVLRLAREAFIWTDGLFNPCLGTVLEHIGYDVSFDRRREPDEAPLVHVHPIVSSQCPYELSSDGRHCRVYPGFQVDVGGKGWIVEQCARVLRDSGFIDFVGR
jgi:FAD:protein FMN transferase